MTGRIDSPAAPGRFGSFDIGPVPMWIWDVGTGRFVDVNRAACALYGYSRREFLEMTPSDLRLRAEEAEPGRDASSGRPVERHRRKHGSPIWVEVLAHATEWRERPTCLGVVFDVTEHVEAAAEMERQRRFYEDILENIDVDIAVLDPELRFEYVNTASVGDPEVREWLLGRTGEDYCRVRGKPLELARRRHASIRKALEKGGRHEEVEGIRDADGDLHFVVRTHLPLFDEDGSVRRILGYGFDRTEQVRAQQELLEKEAQLHRAQRLEATGRLAGGVAHDFNNILTTVRGYTELLMEDLGANDSSMASLREIDQASARAAELVRHLLRFSRRQISRPTEIDLNEFLRNQHSVFRQVLPAHTELELELDGEPAWIIADPGELEQVMLNLLFNARDAMPSKGRLRISSVLLDGESTGPERVRLSVEDDGEGMDPTTVARAFEPFYTTKESGKGTGLGLSVVYGIVSGAKGEVAIESMPGHGTTVTLDFPLTPGPA